MDSGKKIMLGSAVAIAVGAYLQSTAKDLKIVINGVEYPNEGGYIRSKVGGLILIWGGIGLFLYGTFKKN